MQLSQTENAYKIPKSINKSYSDWVCTAVMSNDVMKDLRG